MTNKWLWAALIFVLTSSAFASEIGGAPNGQACSQRLEEISKGGLSADDTSFLESCLVNGLINVSMVEAAYAQALKSRGNVQ